MCELLVIIADKTNSESAAKDLQCFKRGDVIVVVPDGWGWSQIERTKPEWRIVKAPGLSVSTAQDFLASDYDMVNAVIKRLRSSKVDVDNVSIPQAAKNYLADSTRVADSFTVPQATLLALKVAKAAVS